MLVVSTAQSAWQQVGGAGFTAGQSNYTSLVIDSSGTPYVAYQDAANGHKASVMRHPVTCSVGRSLPANTWLMTAPDCVPNPVGINDQYSAGISGTYGTNWIGWKWNTVAQSYPASMAATDALMLGVGNWVYSTAAGSTAGTAVPMSRLTTTR
jgi:hypothetical protein